MLRNMSKQLGGLLVILALGRGKWIPGAPWLASQHRWREPPG